jgi:4-amino-4-deoxy-L-arabinose transferase-like glycosyltransferase
MNHPSPFLRTLSPHATAASVLVEQPPVALHTTPQPHPEHRRRLTALAILGSFWLAIFFASLFAPPLLDDADATHANAARSMLLTGDWVTLHVNGIRYLEKAPLPYWLAALSFRLFGINTFAAHLPGAIAVLLLALLGYHWGRRAFCDRTGLYTGIAILTSAGVFLFTRILIPEVLLSLFLAAALYSFLRSFEPKPSENPDAPQPALSLPKGLASEIWAGAPTQRGGATRTFTPASSPTRIALHPYLMWIALALAVLTKGLVALVFFFGATAAYLTLTHGWPEARRLKPISGILLFLAIAAPWHILAGLRNTDGADGHGFFWFYFINEHILRFLGRRQPVDYNKLPGYLFWSLHLVWLFPWSLFLPLAALFGLRYLRSSSPHPEPTATDRGRHASNSVASQLRTLSDAHPTVLLLTLYTALILIFFSISTNQEYYTFPAYLPLLLLTAAALARAESNTTFTTDTAARRLITAAHAAFTLLGASIAIALALGLWSSRHLPFNPDIGGLLAHRNVGNYTLSMSHFFDLTGPSFAALRLPAILAALAFATGPATSWILRRQRRHVASTVTIALTSAIFLIAAHVALIRFSPMLSSCDLATHIQQLEAQAGISPQTQILLFGDQAYGSSIPFYLGRTVSLVEGRSTSMLFGSTFPDAPHLFLTSADLLRTWGTGPRKLLFVPFEKRDEVDHLLGPNKILLKETSGKALFTDRPLDQQPQHHPSNPLTTKR